MNTNQLDDGPAALLQLRRHISIVHHVPGRVRFRFKPAIVTALPNVDVSALRAAVGNMPGIRDVRINRAALSLVVEYDAAIIPSPTWEELLAGSEDEAIAVTHRFKELVTASA